MAQPNGTTPGPWDAERTGTKCWQIHNGHSPIAEVTGAATRIRYPDVDENAANARLIAAAPDLYAALERIARHLADRCDSGILDLTPEAKLWELALAALRKADGHAA